MINLLKIKKAGGENRTHASYLENRKSTTNLHLQPSFSGVRNLSTARIDLEINLPCFRFSALLAISFRLRLQLVYDRQVCHQPQRTHLRIRCVRYELSVIWVRPVLFQKSVCPVSVSPLFLLSLLDYGFSWFTKGRMVTNRMRTRCGRRPQTREPHSNSKWAVRIGPTQAVWKTGSLPLTYTCNPVFPASVFRFPPFGVFVFPVFDFSCFQFCFQFFLFLVFLVFNFFRFRFFLFSVLFSIFFVFGFSCFQLCFWFFLFSIFFVFSFSCFQFCFWFFLFSIFFVFNFFLFSVSFFGFSRFRFFFVSFFCFQFFCFRFFLFSVFLFSVLFLVFLVFNFFLFSIFLVFGFFCFFNSQMP